MSNDTARPSRSDRDRDDDRDDGRGAIATVMNGSVRLLADLLAISLWVLFLTLLFLETAWPRWTFYALLVVGVGVYVTVTAAWTG